MTNLVTFIALKRFCPVIHMNDTNIPVQLTLVVPCYNESDRVKLLYDGLDSFIEKWKNFLEIIIINDGSKDNTETLLQSHDVYKRHKDIISIYTQANTGKGGALKNGVLRAKRQLYTYFGCRYGLAA